jgi:hypothetical protein
MSSRSTTLCTFLAALLCMRERRYARGRHGLIGLYFGAGWLLH